MEIEKHNTTRDPKDTENNIASLPKENNTFQDTSRAHGSRTLQEDMANAVKRQDRSISQMIIADKKRRRESGYNNKKVHIKENSSGNILKLFLVIVVIALVVFGVKLIGQQGSGAKEPPRREISTAIIPINEQIVLNVESFTNDKAFTIAIISSLLEEKTENSDILHFRLVKEKEVTNIETGKVEKVEATLPVNEFFELWENDTPKSLVRAFGKEDYFFGYYNKETEMTPFLLFELKDFDQTFAGMLEWENVMCENIQNLFTSKSKCPECTFKNAQLLDTDIRVLEIESGKPALMYGFIKNKKMLIITESTAVFKEIKSLFD